MPRITKKLAAAALLAAALMRFADLACAADFYVLYFSKEEENAVILDPLSVVDTPDHHKSALFFNISPNAIWNDEVMEIDCAGKRWKSVSSISHASGIDSVNHATEDGAVPAWQPVVQASTEGREFDIICQWPAVKAKLELYQSPDALTAKRAVSALVKN